MSLRPRMLKTAHIGCLLSALALSAVAVRLPYTTTIFEGVSVEVATTAPGTDSFSVGSVRWELNEYRANPTLEPLRAYFHRHCGGSKTEVAAAECLSNTFSLQFPFGSGSTELFQRHYDPVDALARHSAGEPGDCVTRSGLMTAILLSVGTPARLVQLVPKGQPGHNIVSVWNGWEWVAIDPSTGLRFSRVSETALWRLVGKSATIKFGPAPQGAEQLNLDYGVLFSGYLTYPEPWLYMRVGQRQAHWPFRGKFAELKHEGEWSLGAVQSALRIAVLGPAALWWGEIA